MDTEFPVYDVPSWKLLPKHDEDLTAEECRPFDERRASNLDWFLSNPCDEYPEASVAELLGVPPNEVAGETWNAAVYPQPGVREFCYPAEVVLMTALRRGTWTASDIIESARRLLQPSRVEIDPLRLVVIRSFFLDREVRWSLDELRALFGSDADVSEYFVTSGCLTEAGDVERDDVAGGLASFVPPPVVGRALADTEAGPLANEVRAIEFPRWLWEGLDETARKRGWSVSDVLAGEILSILEGIGGSETFLSSVTRPDYASAVVTMGGVGRAAATRTADSVEAEAAASDPRTALHGNGE